MHPNEESLNAFYGAFAALGAPGLLLGWTPFLRAKVRRQASAGLRKYLAAHR